MDKKNINNILLVAIACLFVALFLVYKAKNNLGAGNSSNNWRSKLLRGLYLQGFTGNGCGCSGCWRNLDIGFRSYSLTLATKSIK